MRATRRMGGRRREPLSGRNLRAWVLLCQHRLSSAGLAKRLGVSVPTAHRVVAFLRRRGETIASVGLNGHRFYEVRPLTKEEWENDPFYKACGTIKTWRRNPVGKEEDADYDTD
ncbi:MAG: HTH domain-containing protein [Planctomycetes bacterium]|nr:HTH domain-containing protein [Planctomycetota bacterium]